jgi:hypothetical protein
MKGWRTLVAAAAIGGALATPTTARAGYLEDAGWGALTMLSNVVYMPAKFVYAGLGGLTGGLTYACTAGDLDAAESVWRTSMAGTYVLTPRMLRGEDAIAFAAMPSAQPEQTAANEPAAWPGVDVGDDAFADAPLGTEGTEQQAYGDKSLGGF